MEKFWCWLICAIVLLLSEFVLPGFIIFFFGIGACVVSVAAFFIPEISFMWQLLIFAVSSVVLLIVSRRYIPGVFRGSNKVCEGDIDLEDMSGETAISVTDINPDECGKVEFRGSLWKAMSGESIQTGERVRIISRKNITLIVEKNK